MKAVVAIDNKPSSQAIVDALIKMHWFEGTELHLVTVIAPQAEFDSHEAVPPELAEIENLAVDLRNALPLCEVSYFPRQGEPKEVILELAEQVEADLIVMGSNCKNTLERLLLGSVSQAVINEAKCPVIVAKTPCCLAREVSPAFRSILVPIDKSIFSDAAIAWLANFAWAPATQFVVVAAVEPNTDQEEVQISLNKRASDLRKKLRTDNVLMEIIEGNPAQSILALAKAHYTDLIVMGAHNRTGIQKLIHGEIAEHISHEAPCAVAIVTGVVDAHGSWRRSETYTKVKPEPPVTSGGYVDRGDGFRPDSTAHIMPGGM